MADKFCTLTPRQHTDATGQRGRRALATAAVLVALAAPQMCVAQSVGLPAPRLLTTKPMGGQVGTKVDVTITGEHLDDVTDLLFSDARLTAAPKLGADGKPIPMQFAVTIAADCPVGVYEARVQSRLGLSTSRIFSVGTLPELVQKAGNTSVATAMELPMNSVCNAVMSVKSADFYTFQGRKGQRVFVDVASRIIDSKLEAVVVIADAMGRDLVVERRSGALDFQVPDDGRYVIKVHELTFQGGAAHYYRLALRELPAGEVAVRQPGTRRVSACSWPPVGLPEQAAVSEIEPNQSGEQAQRITLPCDISGSFATAADVDVFEFEAKAGEVWWVEVGSERLGLPTDPAILVQHVAGAGESEALTDVAELTDIPSPVKVSSNGYAYDGPPYDAGSSDILGKVEIKKDGLHRLQLTDLFGGTRNDPLNVYRLVIRKAAPDFALAAWGLHMELRNGDRNALSKPLSLRGGATMALEVVAIRRDGFDGEIELTMEGLPEGVTAQGIKIAAGKTRGLMLLTAKAEAPRSLAGATFVGRGVIDGQQVTRPCRLASFAWPIPDSWGEIPSPRLLGDVMVSVSGVDQAPITIAPATSVPLEVVAGQKLTVPLTITRRSEFQGASVSLKAVGAGLEAVPALKVTLTEDKAEAVVDTAALKTAPGDYVLAFLGGAVTKFRLNPEAVATADLAKVKADQDVVAIDAEVKKAMEGAAAASAEQKSQADKVVAELVEKKKTVVAAAAAAAEQLKKATAAAQPRDIADIVVTEPIAIRVKPAEPK
jgi:hypothetical protein